MPDVPQSELDQLGGYRTALSGYGNTPSQLLQYIQKQENELRTITAERDNLLGLKPKDTQVVVEKTDADELAAYREINPKPAELKKIVAAGKDAAEKLEIAETRIAAAAFARVAGIHEDAVDTLVAIPQLKGAKFEVRKGKVKNKHGKEVDGEVGYLTLAGEKEKEMTVDEAREKVTALKGLRTADPASSKVTDRVQPPNFAVQSGGSDKSGEEDVYTRIRNRGQPQVTIPESVPVRKTRTVFERLGMKT